MKIMTYSIPSVLIG